MADDLSDILAARVDRPMVGVGYSLGGVLTSHFLPMEQPDEVARLVVAFVDERETEITG